jgi:23S rRNA (cytosine1962-C5)-methyltransferase
MADITSFTNRLKKNLKHFDKWARRRGISCYRVYDRDLPDFPVAIDRYHDHVHVQEYKTRWEANVYEYAAWKKSLLATLLEVMELDEEQLHYKQRMRQKGKQQYEKTGKKGTELIVEENGLKFLVNLDAYLDTGLFLDHRNTRQMVREKAEGKRFLNLFAYTGSFSVYAAAGGAHASITVDMSKTYQDWTRKNFELNEISLEDHQLVQMDVFQYLAEAVQAKKMFGLIMMDPPSFSNSKRMQDILDVQRDHPLLINQCLELLTPGGELIFSNNYRRFRLEQDQLDTTNIKEITAQTLPEDFRKSKSHRCWSIRRDS